MTLVTQLAFNSAAINFRIAEFRHSNLGPKFALKMGPKFALTDIFQNKMGRGYPQMNNNSPKKKVRSLHIGIAQSEVFVSLNLFMVELNAGWVCDVKTGFFFNFRTPVPPRVGLNGFFI